MLSTIYYVGISIPRGMIRTPDRDYGSYGCWTRDRIIPERMSTRSTPTLDRADSRFQTYDTYIDVSE